MAFLEALRKDPTSRFYGVPRDLTQLLSQICRPLQGNPRFLQEKNGWKAVGFDLAGQLIIQPLGDGKTQIVSVPSLTVKQELNLPSCFKLWCLKNGDIVYLLDSHTLRFRNQDYYLEFSQGRLCLVARSTNRINLSYDYMDVSSDGKMYFSGDGHMQEYDLMTMTSRTLYSCEGVISLKLHQDEIYSVTASGCMIYNLLTKEKTQIEMNKQGWLSRIAIDPETSQVYYNNSPDNHLGRVGDSRFILSHLARAIRFFISRSGHLINVTDFGISVYG